MTPERLSESMSCFLLGLGAKRRGHKYILDGFDHEIYLVFDAEDDPERPDTHGTCDIMACRPGDTPDQNMRLIADCTQHMVRRFLFALGANRFSSETRCALYESGSVIRTMPMPHGEGP